MLVSPMLAEFVPVPLVIPVSVDDPVRPNLLPNVLKPDENASYGEDPAMMAPLDVYLGWKKPAVPVARPANVDKGDACIVVLVVVGTVKPRIKDATFDKLVNGKFCWF